MEAWVGREAAEIVTEIVRDNPNINVVRVHRYFPGNPEEVDLFWDFTQEGILLGSWRADTIDRPTESDSLIGLTSLVDLEESLEKEIQRIINYEPAPTRHIPFTYFEARTESLDDVIEKAKRLAAASLFRDNGWIVRSTALGYYICGQRLLTEIEWWKFLLKAKNARIEGIEVPDKYLTLAKQPKNGSSVRYATMRLGTNQDLPNKPVIVGTF